MCSGEHIVRHIRYDNTGSKAAVAENPKAEDRKNAKNGDQSLAIVVAGTHPKLLGADLGRIGSAHPRISNAGFRRD